MLNRLRSLFSGEGLELDEALRESAPQPGHATLTDGTILDRLRAGNGSFPPPAITPTASQE
ncbi:MAG: hypothetical protein A2V88_17335 [Elusimicrobia bacterium RBG_16_66_12]|nr:MAG: hypothetical protein A2V88_17335 [Elusimicrobia bacterium RBG_16_66_12]